MKGYLPTLQGRAKWRIARQNISPGQLVLAGNASDIAKRDIIVWKEFMKYTLKYGKGRKLSEGPLSPF